MQADEQEPVPDPPAGPLDRLVGDENVQLKAAVVCLAGFVAAAAAGGFAWGHLPVVLGLWVGAAALLLCALILGWQPSEEPETTIAYYEGQPPAGLVPAAQPMRQPGPPWGTDARRVS